METKLRPKTRSLAADSPPVNAWAGFSPLLGHFGLTRLVSFYLCIEYLRFLLFTLVLLLGLSLLVDFFDRLDNFIRYGASVSATVRYLVFKIPLFVTQAAPAAALAGALIGCGLLSKNRELIALKACGMSPWQMTLPLLLTAGLLSLAVRAWNEWVVPAAFHHSRYINTVEIKQRPFKGLFHEHGFWYRGDGAFYHIEHFDSQKKIISGLTMYTLDQRFRVRSLVEIARAEWKEDKWQLTAVQETSLTGEEHAQLQGLNLQFQETPEDFSLIDMKAEEFSSEQLRRYIRGLQRKGLDTSEYLVDLHLKSAVPFAALVMTFIGIALTIPSSRQHTLPTVLGLALITGFGYWIVLALSVSLGHSGAIPPQLAAWLANGLAGLYGVFLLLGVD